MAEPPISKKRKRGNPNRKTGLIGVSKNGKKYRTMITYGGTTHSLGTFDTKEQAGIAYDQFIVDKSTEEVSFNLNYPNGLPTNGPTKTVPTILICQQKSNKTPKQNWSSTTKPKKFMSKLNPKQNFKS